MAVAWVLDDSVDFHGVITVLLRRIGVDARCFAEAPEFLKALKEGQPDIALVDLNVGSGKAELGFRIIEAIRAILGQRLRIIVVSAQSDLATVAHALEIGASDFLAKPVDPALLATKLAGLLKTPAASGESLGFFPVPDGDGHGRLDFPARVIEVDELGVRLAGPHLIAKGTVLSLEGALAEALSPGGGPIRVTVLATEFDPATREYRAFAEFEADQEKVLAGVRRWLLPSA